jgi:uncharacterized protein
MKQLQQLFLVILMSFAVTLLQAGDMKKDYPIKPVPFTDVHIKDAFWSARMDINRTVSIPYAFKKCEETGRIDNFAIAGGLKTGKYCGYQFNDSDVFKVIEGAAYSLAIQPDATLDSYLDDLIKKIAAAQEPDGYLYTPRRLMSADYSPPGGKERWVGEIDGSHELYNAGHLYEAAVAHYLATGKRSLLDVAVKNADLVCSTFGPKGRHEVPGHQVIEIGLCKLYRLTGEEKYLSTAKYFLDERGDSAGHTLYGEYAQDHKPVLEQDKAVGHAVRATYMFSGMADVAALTGDASYVYAIDRLWRDVVGTKMYVTGGIGATGDNEGFAGDYVLPNRNAYCETCASIAFAFWNYRMFLFHGGAQYIDVLERVIYNAFLSGVSMQGDRFFYPNPLESFHGKSRSPWFDCACCPGNVARFIPSIPGYIYAHRDDTLYVNLFIGGNTTIAVNENPIHITQETGYPWTGNINVSIDPERSGEFTLKIRIPGWAKNEAVPGDLYNFAEKMEDAAVLKVNGQPIQLNNVNGYAAVQRRWQKGDKVELELPMPIRRVLANEKVSDDLKKVALQRGPIMFCSEWPDNKDGHIINLVLPDSTNLSAEYLKDLLGGVEVIRGKAVPTRRTLDGKVISDPVENFMAIPYYAWAHRGEGAMEVWQAREPDVAKPLPAPTIAGMSSVTISGGGNGKAINDQFEPKNSNDQSILFIHWWPHKGTTEWVQYDFKEPAKISSMDVYWFDDTGVGECRVPQSWRAYYREGSEWKPIHDVKAYGIEKDRYNSITFPPVATDGVKIEIQCQKDFSTGLFEWKVE